MEEEDRDVILSLLSSSYRDGYEHGLEDFYAYDQGCSDAEAGYPKQRFDDDSYDEGYSDCR